MTSKRKTKADIWLGHVMANACKTKWQLVPWLAGRFQLQRLDRFGWCAFSTFDTEESALRFVAQIGASLAA